jgi:hypothetical protein
MVNTLRFVKAIGALPGSYPSRCDACRSRRPAVLPCRRACRTRWRPHPGQSHAEGAGLMPTPSRDLHGPAQSRAVRDLFQSLFVVEIRVIIRKHGHNNFFRGRHARVVPPGPVTVGSVYWPLRHCQLKQRWYAPVVGGAVVRCGEGLGTPIGLSPSQPRGDRKLTSTPLS